jgi:hypothetical protein
LKYFSPCDEAISDPIAIKVITTEIRLTADQAKDAILGLPLPRNPNTIPASPSGIPTIIVAKWNIAAKIAAAVEMHNYREVEIG